VKPPNANSLQLKKPIACTSFLMEAGAQVENPLEYYCCNMLWWASFPWHLYPCTGASSFLTNSQSKNPFAGVKKTFGFVCFSSGFATKMIMNICKGLLCTHFLSSVPPHSPPTLPGFTKYRMLQMPFSNPSPKCHFSNSYIVEEN